MTPRTIRTYFRRFIGAGCSSGVTTDPLALERLRGLEGCLFFAPNYMAWEEAALQETKEDLASATASIASVANPLPMIRIKIHLLS